MSYINLLPKELQEHILDEIPQYTPLNTTTRSGRHYLPNLCQKSITVTEFLNYLQTVQPDKYFIYINESTQFIVLEGHFKFGHYELIAHHLDYKTLIITMVNHVLLQNYLNLSISFDLVTTANIYQLRPCQDVTNYLNHQLDLQLTRPFDNTLTMIINNIKLAYYVVTNSMMLGETFKLAAFTIPLKQSLYPLQFDDNEYVGDDDDLDNFEEYLDVIYQNNIYKIINYINNL